MFVIPVNHQDLLLERDGRYSVQDTGSTGKTAALVSKLEDVGEHLSDPLQICASANFDLLYNVIRYVELFFARLLSCCFEIRSNATRGCVRAASD